MVIEIFKKERHKEKQLNFLTGAIQLFSTSFKGTINNIESFVNQKSAHKTDSTRLMSAGFLGTLKEIQN